MLPGGKIFIAGHQGVTHRFDRANPVVDDPAKTCTTIAGDRSRRRREGHIGVVAAAAAELRAARADRGRLHDNEPPVDPRSRTAEWIDLSAADAGLDRAAQPQRGTHPSGQHRADAGRARLPRGRHRRSRHRRTDRDLRPAEPDGRLDALRHDEIPARLPLGGDPARGRQRPDGRRQAGPLEVGRDDAARALLPVVLLHGPAADRQRARLGRLRRHLHRRLARAASIAEVVLLRPGAVTHGFNMSQRFIGCSITGGGATSLQVEAPPDATIAPPGPYLLFVITSGRIPSEGRWIRVRP